MNRRSITSQRLILLFLIGCLLLSYPLISIFDRPQLVGGFPLLFLYVFAVWLLLIGMTTFILRRKG